ncbi:isoprenylcysteine carboxylmethyltransferase family protein [Litorivicinus lipolyticus]|uniref:Isoprenylcysteine carboxylmethyltransferase family protein n=1 Tax=Litorivicinus lipolyticus TaxID=418701 RepID=A0A5Q2QDQ6_9GAMM|nr:isoprenylcysteine carboxylmethyltransferase family protein [Litorivicinus lipolyticus]QGG80472.1 isoprenylcysteine carboxylmethyltransferase family protein [Litorivicinus lipolyticus]
MKYVPPPLQALIWAGIAWLLVGAFPGQRLELAFGPALVGVLLILGVALDVVALSAFFKRKTSINPINLAGTEQLVTDGPYRYSRNPMYLGMLCYLLALTYWLDNPLAAIAPLGFIMVMNRTQIAREEALLAEKFGAAYQRYCEQVRRWI